MSRSLILWKISISFRLTIGCWILFCQMHCGWYLWFLTFIYYVIVMKMLSYLFMWYKFLSSLSLFIFANFMSILYLWWYPITKFHSLILCILHSVSIKICLIFFSPWFFFFCFYNFFYWKVSLCEHKTQICNKNKVC